MRLIDYSRKLKSNPHDELLRKVYQKRCYELYDSVNGDYRKLFDISIEEGISYITITNNAKEYYEKYIEGLKEEKTWHDKYVSQKIKKLEYSPKNSLYLKLMEENNPEKIIELIKNTNIDVNYLKQSASDFAVVYFPEQKERLTNDLRKKIQIFIDYENKKRKTLRHQQKEQDEQERLENAKEIFEKNKWVLERFINGIYESRQQYCYDCNIDINFFDKLVKYAEIYDVDDYEQYKEIVTNNQKKNFAIIVSSIKRLIDYLENGIKEENNTIRPFDIIDYYLLIKLDFEVILNIIENIDLTYSESKILKNFIKKNMNNVKTKSSDVQQILNPNNKQIIGGRVIELQEKELILNFLKEKEIPKNRITYNTALKRYLNNTLPLEESRGNPQRKIKKIVGG